MNKYTLFFFLLLLPTISYSGDRDEKRSGDKSPAKISAATQASRATTIAALRGVDAATLASRTPAIAALRDSVPALPLSDRETKVAKAGSSPNLALPATLTPSVSATSMADSVSSPSEHGSQASLRIRREGKGNLLGLGHSVDLKIPQIGLDKIDLKVDKFTFDHLNLDFDLVSTPVALRIAGAASSTLAVNSVLVAGFGATNCLFLGLGAFHMIAPDEAEACWRNPLVKGKQYSAWAAKKAAEGYDWARSEDVQRPIRAYAGRGRIAVGRARSATQEFCAASSARARGTAADYYTRARTQVGLHCRKKTPTSSSSSTDGAATDTNKKDK